MRRLKYGEEIKVGDEVHVSYTLRVGKVTNTDESNAYVDFPKLQITLPLIYDKSFLDRDDIDGASYEVFRCDL